MGLGRMTAYIEKEEQLFPKRLTRAPRSGEGSALIAGGRVTAEKTRVSDECFRVHGSSHDSTLSNQYQYKTKSA